MKELTSKQTGDALKDNYGLGFSTGGGTFGHGGAHATNMHIDAKRGLITVWMVQHAVDAETRRSEPGGVPEGVADRVVRWCGK